MGWSNSLVFVPGSNRRRIYLYDELNQLIQVIYEDGRKVTYTYDASGNRITLTNE